MDGNYACIVAATGGEITNLTETSMRGRRLASGISGRLTAAQYELMRRNTASHGSAPIDRGGVRAVTSG